MPATALRVGRDFLLAAMTIGVIGAGPLAAVQGDDLPTFGTTVVVSGGLRGVIYPISPLSRFLPGFQGLHPLGVIYTSTLNVPPRNYREGFPGVTDRADCFAIDYSGKFWIEKPGQYRFELTSDDGSRLYIDDELVVNNDGVHPPQTKSAGVNLAGGIHWIRVSYFQGLRKSPEVKREDGERRRGIEGERRRRSEEAERPEASGTLVMRVAGPGEEWRIFSTEEFKPPPDPATWTYLPQSIHISPATGTPGETVSLELSLNSVAARAPIALKWEAVFPAQLLEFQSDGPELGTAALESGKSLRCTALKPYSFSCSLSGGQNPVANGTIAIFHFKIRTTAEGDTTSFRIQKAEAVTADSKTTGLGDAEGKVTIRQP